MDIKKINKVALIVVGGAILLVAGYIILNHIGLVDGLDFGAGAYYYTDIPDYEKQMKWDAFQASLPYWVYVVLFLVWGALMYLLWKWIDRH